MGLENFRTQNLELFNPELSIHSLEAVYRAQIVERQIILREQTGEQTGIMKQLTRL